MAVDWSLQLAQDVLLNSWQIAFPKGIPGGSNPDLIVARLDQTFTMPDKVIAFYTIDFRGSIILKPSKKEDTDKTITFPVRIDQEWSVYDDLAAWQDMVYDPVTNIALPSALTRIPIVVHNLDENEDIKKSFTFNYCFITNLKPTDWDMSSNEPSRAEVTVKYGYLS